MKNNEYPGLDFTDIKQAFPMDRREFLKLAGKGIFILFTVGDPLALAETGRGRQALPTDFNAFLRVGEDGKVTCFTGKIEMGQGPITSLAQMLADELDVARESVDMTMGDTDLCPWDMGTFGSMTTRFFGPPLRQAGATARRVLLELASEHLKTPIGELTVENGVVSKKSNGAERVTYAQLAKGKRIERRVTEKVPVKTPSEFKVMGKPVTRTDSLEKVTGKAKYAGDIQLPGMLYAKILRPPAHGGKLLDVDLSEVEKMKDVQVVRDGDFIAVLHKYPDEAEKALSKVKAKFSQPELDVDDKTIFDHLLKTAAEGSPVSQNGNIQEGEKRAAATFDETYLDGYVAHAPMEPHTAVARIEGNKATVWASTQTPFPAKDEVARALGFPPENVRVITPFVGGGFGGKSNNMQMVEAARLAKLTGKPVQVAWSRKEEFFNDTFRPAAIVKIRSGVTDEGRISFWDYRVYYAGSRGSEPFYDIPHQSTIAHGSGWGGRPGSHPFGTGPWRAPGNNTNTFARESQIDVMAAKAGIDPVEFRLKNLQDKKMIRVLKAAAEKFGWTAAKAPSGRGYGVACGIDSGTYVTTMAEVEVEKKSGHVQVKRVVCAQDMGLSINPQGATIQIEGCITMGLGYALGEHIRFKRGEILDVNFDTYKLPRFSWLPKIETVVIDDKNASPQGGGEPAIITMGGVIANAIYDAIGVRLLQLPMNPERVKEGLAKA
ncbi:MAG: molybdopterin-dependent oxidoreductase [bacterium]|nr:molybdopterin-dependent oxidoreductase [bacterium]